ncbi:conserved hypothetical protein [Streptomyces sp. SPB78]|nr:conserved hypothetical protein [Streptomyces sp. SPB78]
MLPRGGWARWAGVTVRAPTAPRLLSRAVPARRRAGAGGEAHASCHLLSAVAYFLTSPIAGAGSFL